MRLRTTTVPGWPRLAWIAICEEGSEEVTVFVGPGVEATDDWVCEGIWDGPYTDGGLDRTDLVFGSGVRRRDDTVAFVSSGTTVDRLHAWDCEHEHYVSNSLPCLLAFARASLDLFFDQYGRVSRSIVKGLDAYERNLPTTAGPVRLMYFHNFLWDGYELSEVSKPDIEKDFRSYGAYRNFLDEAMERLATNARAPERRNPFELIATCSTGYDSPTSAVFASQVGCRQAFWLRPRTPRSTRQRCNHREDPRPPVPYGRDEGLALPADGGRPLSGRAHFVWLVRSRSRGPRPCWRDESCSPGSTATGSGAARPRTSVRTSSGATDLVRISPSTGSGLGS